MSENDNSGDTTPSSSEENPYRAPEAELSKPLPVGEYGSIEKTLAGQANLEFGNTLSDAWRLTKGAKRILLGGAIVMYLVLFAVLAILSLIIGVSNESIMASLVLQVVAGALVYPFLAGVYMTAVRQSVGLPISFAGIFAYFGSTGALIALGVLVSLGTFIGYMLLIIPGLYLSVAWVLATPLLIDRSMGVWEAMETSRKVVSKKWFTVFFTVLVAGLITGISALLIIPLLWTIPWMVMIMGVIYRDLAGVATTE